MRRTLLLTLLFLLSAAVLYGQDAAQTAAKTSGPTTIEGCLHYTDSHYRLTDDSGKTYQLSNEANRLTHFVGKRIQVTGMPGTRTVDTTTQGLESSVAEQSVFKVKTVKGASGTCQK
jgi:hypothetical protein